MDPKSPATRQLSADKRHHIDSMLMRESLLDKQVMSSTETPVVPMLPFCHVVKIGGRSIIDNGKKAVYPLVDAIRGALSHFKLVIGTGGGLRSRHVTSIGMDLGMPTGVLSVLGFFVSIQNAKMIHYLLAKHGIPSIEPAQFAQFMERERVATGALAKEAGVEPQ